MSKRGYISRYMLIVKKLKAKPYSSYVELKSYIENQVEYLQMQDDTLEIGFSKRTLQRDIREIRNNFGFDIEFSKSSKGYYIVQSESENMNFQRMMEAFDMFNSLNQAQDMTPYIHLEKRRPQGTENLYGLLHAIKNRLLISFTYQKFWEDEITQRQVHPYALKEFKNRWYVVAKDLKDDAIKTFGLDRLSDLEISKKKFDLTAGFNIEEHFRYCFGIVSPNSDAPEEIILSFDPVQGKYIKTLPLHETQKVIIDDEEELVISLKLYVTHDLIMELLSFGNSMAVIKPESLFNEIKSEHWEAYKKEISRNFEEKVRNGTWSDEFDLTEIKEPGKKTLRIYAKKGLEE
ncbi:MAG: WYL domain-containing protein [Bacteroidia bacterium]|nr:WYL domain-containing protein [Bacteroidia bacterium]